MSFAEIIGHGRVLKILRRTLGSGRVAHAYLFAGPDGVGKATVAQEFARALLCCAREAEACDVCESCRKVQGGSHPDLVRVESEGAQILVGQVRELQRVMGYRPLEGPRRVVILDRGHDLNVQAANALLKLLEEPPEGNVLILVARSDSSLLPTVVSRCQAIHFSPLSPAEVARYLQERLGWEPDAAGKAAVRCGGSIGEALSLKEEESGEGGEEAALLLKEIRGLDGPRVLEVARAWAGDREKARVRLELLRSAVRDALLLTLGRKDVDRADLRDSLEVAARQWGVASLLKAWEQVGEALRGMERNGNPQLIMEDLLLGFRESHASARGMGAPHRALG